MELISVNNMLNLFCIFILKAETTTTHKLDNEHTFLSYIFYLDILFDFSKNDYEAKSYVAQYALGFSLNRINILQIKNKLYFYSILNK